MKKERTYRIIYECSAYSKKKGEYRIRRVHAKGIATLEDAAAIVAKDFPSATEVAPVDGTFKCYRTPGMLYAGNIEIR